MTLLETLTLAVGPAIAKAILKIWLKDEHITLDAASALVDAIKSRTTDVIAQQQARRQFEAIPADRVELYEACCYMLLERRDLERRINLKDYPQLKYRQKRALLEDLSYHMLQNAWPMISFQRMQERLAFNLPTIEGLPQEADETNVRRYFVERSGLMRQPAPDKADFTHRTFQEFLAAQAAVNEGDVGVLLKNATDDQWREVIILAAGLANKKEREELISGLLARGESEPMHQHQLHMLAVATLETSVELSPAVKAKLTERLSQLVPPRNMSEAKALASAGELAVPYLAIEPGGHSYTAATCIRALSLIGGDAALSALATYAGDYRKTVLLALLKAKEYFDKGDFRSQVLSRIKDLSLDWPTVIQVVQDVAWLTELRTWADDYEVDCSCLSHLNDLAKLSITSTRLTPKNLGCLGPLNHFVDLSLEVNDARLDLSQLRKLKHLRKLTVSAIGADLEAIKQLTNLRELNVFDMMLTYDLAPLAELRELTALYIRGLALVSDLSPLGQLTGLRQLHIESLACKADYSPLASLTSMTHLTIWCHDQPLDLRPLAGLTNLKHLILGGTKDITLPDNFASQVDVRIW
ncbi:MAG TPA: hypothetical protein VMV72_03215 [Verrucomicrobiae bacterium]|nr:hypothetical protein [Verrucomicrobiae bacterium]